MTRLMAALIVLSLALGACGLGWGEDPGIAEPDTLDDCWEDCRPVYPDADSDAEAG